MENSTSAHVLFFDNQDSFTYNIVDLFSQCGSISLDVIDSRDVRAPQDVVRRIAESGASHCVIGPGPGSPGEYRHIVRAIHHLYPNQVESWHLRHAKAPGMPRAKTGPYCNIGPFSIEEYQDFGVSSNINYSTGLGIKSIPVLGICLGHQMIIEAYGGVVQPTGNPVHGKTSDVFHMSSRLFQSMTNPFRVGRYHSLAALSVPFPLKATAYVQDNERKTSWVMAVEHRSFPIFGVQFHPESFLSEHGLTLLGNFLKMRF